MEALQPRTLTPEAQILVPMCSYIQLRGFFLQFTLDLPPLPGGVIALSPHAIGTGTPTRLVVGSAVRCGGMTK